MSIKNKRDTILEEVEKELKENAEDIANLLTVDTQGIVSMMNEYSIQMFSDSSYTIKDIIKNLIQGKSSKMDGTKKVDGLRGSTESFFITNIGALFSRYKLWKRHLPKVEIFYAVKCNPDEVILRTLAQFGTGFDVASRGEISIVKELGTSPDNIIFANPVKIESHITYADLENVSMMTFDSENELIKIKLHYPHAKLVLRVLVDDTNAKISFGAKFGCPRVQIDGLLMLAKQLTLDVIGVSFHVGTDCTSSTSHMNAIKYCREIFDVAKKYEYNLYLLDIGGGFGGFDSEVENEKFIITAKHINEELEASFKDIPNLRIISEPGRFFAASCCTLVTKLIGGTMIDETVKYFVESSVYGVLNNVIFDKAKIEIKLLKEYPENCPKYKSVVFGSTCDSMDCICPNVILPKLNYGNWVYIENLGAYTTAASSNFNGNENPINKYIFIC